MASLNYLSLGRPPWLVHTRAFHHCTPWLWTAGSRCQDPATLLHPAPSAQILVRASMVRQTPLSPSSLRPPPLEPEAFWSPQRLERNESRPPGANETRTLTNYSVSPHISSYKLQLVRRVCMLIQVLQMKSFFQTLSSTPTSMRKTSFILAEARICCTSLVFMARGFSHRMFFLALVKSRHVLRWWGWITPTYTTSPHTQTKKRCKIQTGTINWKWKQSNCKIGNAEI